MVDHGPVLFGAEQGRGEDDRVERDVVFGHELVERYLVGVLPPPLPLLRVVSRDRHVTNRRVVPYVKHLVKSKGTF